MTPFNWDHPSLRVSHLAFDGEAVYTAHDSELYRDGVTDFTLPSFVLPKRSWWTTRRMGIFALVFTHVLVFELGMWFAR